ncbi:MAG: VOC family protein [bacterium]|nr:VOC family protein [bacterium]
MLIKIDHTAITCTDLTASLKFYTEVLGFTETDRLDFPENQMHLVYVEKNGDKIELFGYDKPVETVSRKTDNPLVGFTHLALLVENLDQMVELLKQKGIKFEVEPMDAKGNVRIAFFKDPDGNVIELIER